MLTAPISRRAFVIGSAAVMLTGCLGTRPTGHVRLAAGDPGGLYLAFGTVLAERLRAHQPGLTVEVLPTEGTVQNLALLRSGEADLGLALADVAEQDRAVDAPDAAPSAIARVYENYLQVIVRADTAVHHFSDLQDRPVSVGPPGSGAATTSEVLFRAAGLHLPVDAHRLRLREGLAALADGRVDAVVWSGGVPTPAIAELDERIPLRMLDIGELAAPMSAVAGYPYVVRRVPAVGYVESGTRSLGVPDLLLCRQDLGADVAAAVVDVLAADAPHLVPPYIRGLQYLDTPSMIQTGLIPLHPDAVRTYQRLHG
ncbi:TAXI family TRAP transporter solute-binding subunit [Mycolicibacterium sp.]|uniref:TAXI family TRAP transporter solute-binding subunit n=1 Tax=Mycolicibacterium sp. TaxID=2320850 RepID=UPI003D109DC6